MKQLILRTVNGLESEWSKIVALLLLGFVGGVFIATFSVGTEALFLDTFPAKEYVPRAFAASGVLGIVVTFAFGRLQRRLTYKKLTYTTYSILTILVVFIAVGLHYFERNWLIFLAYVVQAPITALLVLLFWLTFGRLFEVRQAKRLSSGIDTGSSFATIATFFAIPIFQTLIGKLSDILLISAFAIGFALVLIVYINRRFEFIEHIQRSEIDNPNAQTQNIYRGFYIWLMAGFVVCSTLAAGFVEYSFLHTAEYKFSGQEKDLAGFLSFFNGMVMVVSFLIQSFLNDRIVEIFGMRNSLLLLPSLLLFFNILTVLSAHFFGYTPNSEFFLVFFVVVSVSKLFTDGLRDSLESPTFKTFFFPLPINYRFEIQAFVEGTVKESAGFFGGLFLLGLGLFPLLELIHVHYIIFFIIGLWGFITLQLYRHYQQKLTQTLQQNKAKHQSTSLQEKQVADFRYALSQTAFNIRFTYEVNPYQIRKAGTTIDELTNPDAQLAVLHVVKNLSTLDALPALHLLLSQEINPVVRQETQQVVEQLEQHLKESESIDQIMLLVSSKRSSQRKSAALLIGYEVSPETVKALHALLRDAEPEVRRAAIFTAGKLRLPEFMPLLLSYFALSGYQAWAVAAVTNYGETVLETLETWFYRTGQTTDNLLKVIHIYSEIKSDKSIQYLTKKINHPEKIVRFITLKALQKLNWQADQSWFPFFKTFIEQAVETILWNEIALTEIPTRANFRTLAQALEDEIESNKEEIFLYLSLVYNADAVSLVAYHLQVGTSESIGYALELLDVFLDDSLKPLIIPVLDDISPTEKLAKLEVYVTRDRYDSEQVIQQILNRDTNLLSAWTKACAVYNMENHTAHASYALSALLFHPNQMLSEIAAYRLAQTNHEAFENILSRLPTQVSKRLRHQVSLPIQTSAYHRALMLAEIPYFKQLSAEKRAQIAEMTTVATYEKRQVVWDGKVTEMPLILLIEGSLQLVQAPKTIVMQFERGSLINDVFNYDIDFHYKRIIAATPSLLLTLNRDDFFDFAITHLGYTHQATTATPKN